MSASDDRIRRLLTHASWLERQARRLAQDPNTADDALQSTWLNALRSPPDTQVRARAWLRAVLVHEVALDHRRRQRRLRHENLACPVPDVDHDPALGAEAEESWALVLQRLASLPEPYRSTLRLRFFEDMTSIQIAKRQGIPAPTVRWRVMAGLRRLREALRRRQPPRGLRQGASSRRLSTA